MSSLEVKIDHAKNIVEGVRHLFFLFHSHALPPTSLDGVSLVAFGLYLLVHTLIFCTTMSNPVGIVEVGSRVMAVVDPRAIDTTSKTVSVMFLLFRR